MLAGDKENAPNVLLFSPPRAMKREEVFKVSICHRHMVNNFTVPININFLDKK